MKQLLKQLLLIREVRIIVGKIRFLYYAKVIGKIKTSESGDAIANTIKHNLKSVGKFGNPRMDKIIKPLSVLENVSRDAKILVIGPRNEEDILNLMGHGFSTKNMIGLDLISYSPYIEIGDMHQTRFENSYFDVIICGWTLSYSNQPNKFAEESLRILKNGGIIAIGVEYSAIPEKDSQAIDLGYKLKRETGDRINSTKDILDLYENHVDSVYFDHNAPNKISHLGSLNMNVSNVISIFSIKK